MRARAGFLKVALLAVAACGARSGLDVPVVRVPETPDATTDATLEFFDATDDVFERMPEASLLSDVPLLPDAGPPPRILDCAEAGTTYIYVVDQGNNLYSFYPATAEFTLIGAIRCPAPPGAEPFSMAVDHKGVAYVEFAFPESTFAQGLYRVSTKTAACEATSFVANGIETFGMGFVANTGDGGAVGETLYVTLSTTSVLASINVETFAVHNVGTLRSSAGIPPVSYAELTGTGGGNLYGFFAAYMESESPPSYIVHINPATAAVESGVVLPGVTEGSGWAFGFWGGDFYMFTAPNYEFDSTSVVTRYRPSDESVKQVATAPAGAEIVGAGVSTCAPQQ